MSRLALGIDIDFRKVSLAERMRRCGRVTYDRKVRGRCFEQTEAS